MEKSKKSSSDKGGFTLLELLIVIAVLAILSAILIIVLNPAEVLKKSRDVQRMSDLNTLKTALWIYVTTVNPPLLDNTSGNTLCVGGSGADSLWVSYSTAEGTITSTPPTGFAFVQRATQAASAAVSGTGWIPVNFAGISGGSPIASLPLDPSNTVANAALVTNDDLIYRYSCAVSPLTFEINAKLESTAYTSDDNKAAKDGGNNPDLYEVGTGLTILPATDDF